MMTLNLPTLERFAAALRQPATLGERGVHAPFTSPLLFGARLRLGPSRGLEVVMPNPSGRRDWLVMPWSAALDSCQPSLADRALVAALATQKLGPASLRAAMREVAASGLAGRRVARAAQAPAPPAGLRAQQFVLSLPKDHQMDEQDHVSRLSRAARLATQCAAALRASPGGAERADWVLDGWDLLAALWQVAETEQRQAILQRMSVLAPLPSDDMLAWPGCAALAGAQPVTLPGPQPRFATQAQCELALASWLGSA